MDSNLTPGQLIRRLAYAFLGLLAGDAILLVYLVCMALRDPVAPLLHPVFVFYAFFSFMGWIIIGLPVVLLFSARSIKRLSWPLKVLVGAGLGPIGLLPIMWWLNHAQFDFNILRATAIYAPFSIVISTVSFVVYAALLHRE